MTCQAAAATSEPRRPAPRRPSTAARIPPHCNRGRTRLKFYVKAPCSAQASTDADPIGCCASCMVLEPSQAQRGNLHPQDASVKLASMASHLRAVSAGSGAAKPRPSRVSCPQCCRLRSCSDESPGSPACSAQEPAEWPAEQSPHLHCILPSLHQRSVELAHHQWMVYADDVTQACRADDPASRTPGMLKEVCRVASAPWMGRPAWAAATGPATSWSAQTVGPGRTAACTGDTLRKITSNMHKCWTHRAG